MKRGKWRRAVFIVLYTMERGKNGEISYLLLKRKLHWKGWEFPKGKIEPGESKAQAASREAHEESGLKIKKLKRINISGKYRYPKVLADRPGVIGQTYQLFAGEVKADKKKVKLDKREHSGFKWQGFQKAMKMLKWPNQKRCLKITNNLLMKKSKSVCN